MKNETGKGSIKLIIGLAVILVVIFFGVRYFKEYMNKESVKDLQFDLLLIQNKIEIIEGNYSMNKEANPLIGYQLTQLPESINLTEFLEKNIIPQEEYEKYYVLDARRLRTNGSTGNCWKISGIFYS